jgi:maltose O-acetyltransferase
MYKENIKISKSGIKFTDKHGNELDSGEAIKKAANRVFNWWMDFKLYILHIVSLHVPFWAVRKAIFKMTGITIGKGTTIHMGCKYFDPKGVVIGEDTIVGDRAFLDGRDRLIIGKHVDIASEVMIYNSEHDINDENFSPINGPVEIGDYVFIGPRAIILPGIKIGKGAIIAAGAVVTKNVGDREIAAGVPAKVIGIRNLNTFNYKLGRARLFQ